MSTTTHSTTLGHHVGADRSVDTVGQVLWQRIKSALARIKAAIEDRQVRAQLAALPDSLLRDIGIAEDEIHRIRACERFTPRAWAERMGHTRRHFDV